MNNTYTSFPNDKFSLNALITGRPAGIILLMIGLLFQTVDASANDGSHHFGFTTSERLTDMEFVLGGYEDLGTAMEVAGADAVSEAASSSELLMAEALLEGGDYTITFVLRTLTHSKPNPIPV